MRKGSQVSVTMDSLLLERLLLVMCVFINFGLAKEEHSNWMSKNQKYALIYTNSKLMWSVVMAFSIFIASVIELYAVMFILDWIV